MSIFKSNSKKEKIKNFPVRELVFIASIIAALIIVELLTDWDRIILGYLEKSRIWGLRDFAINAMIAGLIFSVYAALRLSKYKKSINKRLGIENHLKRSQEKLDIILSNSSTVVYMGEAFGEYKTTYVSGNVKSILGYEPEEFFQPHFWANNIHPDDAKEVFASMASFHEAGHWERELRMKHKDGSWRWMSNKIKLIRDEDGKPKEVVGSWFDLTEKRNAEAAVRKSEERFQLAAKASNDVIYDWDPATNMCWVNEKHFTLFGYEYGGNTIKMDWFLEKVHPEDKEGLDQSINETFENKKDFWSGEYRFLQANGTYAFIFDRGFIVYSDDGTPTRWIGTMSDITQLKQIEAEVRQAKEKAEESTRAKSEFLANMSHEIRTPLNGIIGMTEMALETNLTSQQERYLNIVKSSSETLMGLINDILDFSKIDAGKLELSPVPFSLRDEVAKSLQVLGLKAAEKGIEFIFRLDADVPDNFIGDILRLQQIIMNLAGNAIKFTKRGEVILHVELKSILSGKAVLQFSVSDTGIGIPAQKLSGIFDEFTQVDSSTSRKYGGTGLGLAISKRLVEMMEGSIWAESIEGKGSSFHFTVVLTNQKNESLPPFTFVPELKNKQVLIAQGNQSAGDYSKELFYRFGMIPFVIRTGEIALAELKNAAKNKKPYKLIVLDTQLAGQMDGFDLAEKIKDDIVLRHSPIIVVSMSQKASDRERFAQSGITHFLSKPFSPSDLLDSIQTIFAEKKELQNSISTNEIFSYEENENKCLSILIAEDNIVNQEVAVSMLTRQGYKVKVAGNGEEAIAATKKELFDLILMDIQMPLMNGYEATNKIREIEKQTGTHTYIIGLTANAMTGDKEKCLRAGMDGYISKPMHLKDLTAAIAKLNFKKENLSK